MNKLQRLLLIFFAVLVLFSGSSYSENWTYLQLFLAATLLFFGLSPGTWFHRSVPITQDIVSSSEPSQETDHNDSEDEELKPLPVTELLTPESLLLLKSLVKLRSAEIANIYLQVRRYQKEAKDGNWVPLFMQQMAVAELQGPYVHVEKKEKEKTKAKAMAIFEKRYKFCSIAPTELYEDQIGDLQVALLYWHYPPKIVIHRLEEFKSFGFLGNWIDALIKAYQTIDCRGFEAIFKEKKGESFISSLKRISSLWSEIIRILKMNMLLQQIKNEIPNEQYADENIDLQEIAALIELERYLDCAITQENLKEKGVTSLLDKDKEKFLINRLKFNPFWYYYSYS